MTKAIIVLIFSLCLVQPLLADDRKIPVGVILPLTGSAAPYGLKVQAAINTVHFDHATLYFEDEECESKATVRAFSFLKDTKRIRLFMGPMCGSPQEAVAPLLASKGFFSLLTSSASEHLFSQAQGNIFSVNPSIEAEATFLAQELNKKQVKKIAALFVDNQFSRAHLTSFKKTFQGQVVAEFPLTSSDKEELRAAITKIRSLKIEALYIPDAYIFFLGVLRELAIQGQQRMPIYSNYVFFNKELLAFVGDGARQVRYSYPKLAAGEDALTFYPMLGAQLLNEAINNCYRETELGACIKRELRKKSFSDGGGLPGEFVLR